MHTTSCRAPILLFFCVWTYASPPKKCAFHVYLLTGHLSAPVEVIKALKVICIKTNAPSDQRLCGTSSVLTLKTYKLSVFSMMSFSWFLGQYFSISHSNFIGSYIAIFVGAPADALILMEFLCLIATSCSFIPRRRNVLIIFCVLSPRIKTALQFLRFWAIFLHSKKSELSR